MRKIFFVLFLGVLLVNFSCSEFDSDEKLAKRSCGGCHLAPEPDMLTKEVWQKHVLPRMGAWLGVEDAQILKKDMAGRTAYARNIAEELIPSEPLITSENWQRIQEYYIKNAPDSLESIVHEDFHALEDLFEVKKIKLKNRFSEATNTLIHFDQKLGQFFIGRRNGEFRILDSDFQLLDSIKLASSPVDIEVNGDNDYELLLTGEIRPNNEPIGSLIERNSDGLGPKIQNLYRPVFFEKVDLNGDQIDDYVICNFGFHVGKLAWYEGTKAGGYKEHLLLPVAGAIQVKVEDLDGDGVKDILALFTQGDESVTAFMNKGRGNFIADRWLQLPPVYGTTAFEFIDFNKDGFKDIVIASGDNADYSLIHKPYHGVRFYQNDGRNHFKEASFYPLHGAAGVEVNDFDQDGELDVAVIANFAIFNNRPQKGFVFYKGLGDFRFEPYLSSATDAGRYLVYEQADFDKDGDMDLVLGSHMVPLMVPREEYQLWRKEALDLLILENKKQ
ncbi:FG-GAP repeat domain-containing protein [Jiulongibacter sp. NS-SX5]|uniref:FG-GAP repeat domain-containing protein n=1 Tax=Jiulongibacter sp. NS-SX5 TaxID=3463854 RepID=UPI0040597859